MTRPTAIAFGVGSVRGVGGAEAIRMDVTNEARGIAAFNRAMNPGPGRKPADVVVSNTGNNAIID